MGSRDRDASSSSELRRRRALGGIETSLAVTDRFSPLNLVTVLRIEGPSVADALPVALGVLQARHPLLRARIVTEPRGFFFEISPAAGPGPIPVRRAERPTDATWTSEVEAELNARIVAGAGPLVRCVHVEGLGPASEILLTTHHSMIDGVSAATMLHELMECCAQVMATGGGAHSARDRLRPPPPSTDRLLPPEHRRIGRAVRFALREGRNEILYRIRSRGARLPIPAGGRSLVLPVEIEPATSAVLLSRARRERVTPNAFLSAAMLLQADRFLHGSRPATLRGLSFGDLRPYLRPPVQPEDLGCYITMLRYDVEVDPHHDLWSLARTIQSIVHRATKRGDGFTATRLSAPLTRVLTRWPVARLATVALSYAGPTPVAVRYGPIEVREVHAFVSNNRVGAELAAVANRFRGSMWCDLLYLDSDSDRDGAARIGEGLRSTLAEAASSTASP